MPGVLADNDVQGHFERLLGVCAGPRWGDIWKAMGYTVHTFESLDIARDASDRAVWEECQRLQVVLITGNRNDEGPDSLEATIRERNSSGALPVITLAEPKRILASKSYANRVAQRLLEYLMDMEHLRGTGRLFVP